MKEIIRAVYSFFNVISAEVLGILVGYFIVRGIENIKKRDLKKEFYGEK
jgi:hypothetical protein